MKEEFLKFGEDLAITTVVMESFSIWIGMITGGIPELAFTLIILLQGFYLIKYTRRFYNISVIKAHVERRALTFGFIVTYGGLLCLLYLAYRWWYKAFISTY